MKYQYMFVTALLSLAALSARAQVKIGSNPTSLTTTANLQVEATNGSQVVVNKTTGNVGIGTVAPGARLHVLNGNAIFNPTGTNALNVGVGNTATNPVLSVPRGAIEFQSGENTATTPIFNFFSNFGGEALSRLTVLQNGNVGIGTTTPVEKLHINGNVLSLGNFYSFSTQYGIGTKPSTTNVFGLNIGGIEFETAAGTSMKVASDGNVGIGTTSPAAKLDVNGSFKLTDGTQGAGKVLTSDANGVASWVAGAKISLTQGSVPSTGLTALTGSDFINSGVSITLTPGSWLVFFNATYNNGGGATSNIYWDITSAATGYTSAATPGIVGRTLSAPAPSGLYCPTSAIYNVTVTTTTTFYLWGRPIPATAMTYTGEGRIFALPIN